MNQTTADAIYEYYKMAYVDGWDMREYLNSLVSEPVRPRGKPSSMPDIVMVEASEPVEDEVTDD